MSVIDIEPDAQGKVRDLYDLGDRLLVVAPIASPRSTTFSRTKFPIRARCSRSFRASGSNCSTA